MTLQKVGGEFLVNTQTANDQRAPTITGLPNGGFVVSWYDESRTLGDASGASIKAQVFDAGGAKVGTEFLVNTQTEYFQSAPTITGLANGGFVVSWQDLSGTLGDPYGSSIKAQIFGAGGAKIGAEFLVNTKTFESQFDPTITGLANGGFVVSWQDYGGTPGESSYWIVKAQVFDGSGAKIGSEFLVNTQTASDKRAPTIAGLANGGFVVSWTDTSGTLGDTSGSSVKAQIFGAGGAKIGAEFLVNTQTANNQSVPTITGLANGGFVVSWEDHSGTLSDASGFSIKAQIFGADGARMGGEFLVNTQTANDQYVPTITGLANGGFVVSWTDGSGTLGDSSASSIKAQVFDAGGAKIGGEFLVNTQTVLAQYLPTITGLANGGFVVSWYDYGGTLGDASGTSVKAQIFALEEDPANHAPVITSDGGGDSAAISLAEDGLAVTTVAAEDVDSDARTYAISGGADAGLFGINAATGALAFLVEPDFEAPADFGGDNIYEVIVSASDGFKSDTQALTVTVTDVIHGNIVNGTEADDIINTKRAPPGQPKATALDDLIYGLGGKDVIDGGAGADQMRGGLGDDKFTIDNAGDQAIEAFNEGNDQVSASVTFTLGDNVENLTLTGTIAIDGTGNSLANKLTGNAAANTLTGNDGADQLKGMAGNDVLWGGAGADNLDGGAGADEMHGGADNDSYTVDDLGDAVIEAAGEGTDTVKAAVSFVLGANIEKLTLTGSANIDGTGNDLANSIKGNAGNNVLTGGGGKDTLTGGLGADTFVFGPPLTSAADKIIDFEHGVDHICIQLSDYGFSPGSLPPDRLASSSFATLYGAQFFYDATRKTLYWDPDGALWNHSPVAVATFHAAPNLTAEDFVII